MRRISASRGLKRLDKQLRKKAVYLTKDQLAEMQASLRSVKEDLK